MTAQEKRALYMQAYEAHRDEVDARIARGIEQNRKGWGKVRLTDRNGLIAPIELPVPDKSESQAPEAGEKPYTTVNLYARLKGYEQIEAENLQVFADTTTNQNLEMIPLSEFPNQWDQTEIFNTPPQNL